MFINQTFRQQFPEFADPNVYPDTTVTFWSGVAGTLLNADRFSTTLDYATSLFVAHHLVLAARDTQTAAMQGTPGNVRGIQSSKSADGVSVSYDTSGVSLADQGYWGSSSYGIRFLQLSRMFGAGGLQLC